jgi:DNA-binding MarR family transcriptional regulator
MRRWSPNRSPSSFWINCLASQIFVTKTQVFAGRVVHVPATTRSVLVDHADGTQRAEVRSMHAVPFLLKRAYQASLKMLRPIAARQGLTPGRFDLLYALEAIRCYAKDQTALAKRLGVTRPTVCKMVRALEKAGFLERRVAAWDRRFRHIEMTSYGRRRFAKLLKRLPVVDRNYYRSMYHWERSRLLRRQFLDQVNWRVAHLARALGDEALLYR